MFRTRTEHDRITLSPEGRLFMVEYAIAQIRLHSTEIVLKKVDKSILFQEKPSSVEKIDDHIPSRGGISRKRRGRKRQQQRDPNQS